MPISKRSSRTTFKGIKRLTTVRSSGISLTEDTLNKMVNSAYDQMKMSIYPPFMGSISGTTIQLIGTPWQRGKNVEYEKPEPKISLYDWLKDNSQEK